MNDPVTCPHCGLPAELPEQCTPELNEAIDKALERDWELFHAGYRAGKVQALEEVFNAQIPGGSIARVAEPAP